MKEEEKNGRFALTLLFSAIVFCILIASLAFSGLLLFILVRTNAAPRFAVGIGAGRPFVWYMALASLLIGSLFAFVFGGICMRPINTIINGMNRLASGDFSVRIGFPKPFRNHPTVEELTESFNTMAYELESTEVLRSDFINNFAHEFKTPIVSIAGFAELLRKGNVNEEEKKEYLEIIESESRRLAHMATNTLNLTKIENQNILKNVTRYNLSEQLRTCVLMLEDKWTKKNLELFMDFDEYYVCADEDLLRQVWINLLDNAIKYSDESGLVSVSIEEQTGSIEVSITNTGKDIPANAREKIFRKFYQADQSHGGEGNGIGLALVKKVVELHQGKVTVSSAEGVTTFTVALPQSIVGEEVVLS